jgi:anaerobic dimethyl sulfoxide reductase subunit B (iron-sulfur subunit)
VACKDWNDIPAGPEKWMRLLYTEKGEAADIFVSYLAVPCYQCLEPVCIPACPAEAITKREKDGIVLVDQDACLGNRDCDEKCLKACPYDAPQFGPETGAKMRKCDFCSSRWEKQQLPVCVEACPTRAFDAGPLEELRAKYGDVREAESFKYSSRTIPAVVFKRKTK